MKFKSNILVFFSLLSFFGIVFGVFASTGEKSNEFSKVHKIELGQTAFLNLSKSDWYYMVSNRLKRPVKVIQSRKDKGIMGTFASNLEVTSKNDKVNADKIISKKCQVLEKAYASIKDINGAVRFIKSNKNFPACLVTVDRGDSSRSGLMFITKRKGPTKDFSYHLHSITLTYPNKSKQLVSRKIKEIIKNIKKSIN